MEEDHVRHPRPSSSSPRRATKRAVRVEEDDDDEEYGPCALFSNFSVD